MSGPFVQRGEPALCDKWARTRMALAGGVDVVLELPFCYAARSAYYFARGALLTLQAAGATHLVFGSEAGDLGRLGKVAAVLAHESPSYQEVLKGGLARGLSYPSARARAIEYVLHDDSPEMKGLLSGPNNILGMEYLRLIHELNLQLNPVTISRQGADYHDQEVSGLASATAIRHAIHCRDSQGISLALPADSLAILQEEMRAGRAPIPVDGLEMAILNRLRLASPAWLKGIYEITEGLENRLLSAAQQNGTLPALRNAIKSKRYNLTRVNRMLLYSLFAVSKNQMTYFDRVGPQYIRLLGFSSKGRKILHKLKNNSNLPVLSTGRHIAKLMKGTPAGAGLQMLSLDIQASDVFSLLAPNPLQRQGGQDYLRQVIEY
jgi:predicted nucleotidyltransferase